MPFRMICIAVPFFAFGCTDGGGDNASETFTVRMATLFGKEHHLAQKLEWMKTELEKRSGGRFQCKVFPGGTVGGEKENLEDLLSGNLEVMNGAGSYFYHFVPEASVLELPHYRWQSKKQAWETIRAYWPKFAEVSEKKGYTPIGLDIRDYWGVFYKTPVDSLAAVKNAKFRSVNADLWIKLTEVYGAVPNPIPYADAYMAFKTGVAEGSLGSVTGAVAANWHEVLKCFFDTRLVLSESLMLASTSWLKGLPEDLRTLFLEVSRESEEFNFKAVEKQYAANKQEMLDAGVKWIKREDIDMSELDAKVPAWRDEYMQAKGPEVFAFYKDWLSHVEEYAAKFNAENG